jgi:hypothetical protein
MQAVSGYSGLILLKHRLLCSVVTSVFSGVASCPPLQEVEKLIHEVSFKNVGAGTALNIKSELYTREQWMQLIYENGQALPFLSQSIKESGRYHWTFNPSNPLSSNEKLDVLRFRSGHTEYNEQTVRIRKKGTGESYPFYAPPDEAIPQTENSHKWRLIITYHDIFSRKHASIFDWVWNEGWQKVAILDDIEYDLQDLRSKPLGTDVLGSAGNKSNN